MVYILQGEAYVECDKNDKTVLTVQTKNATLTAVAAAFNIHASFSATTVALAAGNLEVRDTALPLHA
ncbi:MAG: FecR domain-containing protein [Chitinophagaceae bacterium]|nr:FecR domain-containing protein [Chitinophagaceae bacterium]MCW5927157.1 FecR domain-containing protein [Chitinophagaceae bacterium]